MPAQKEHWDNIYNRKQLTKASWYEECPSVSLNLIQSLSLLPDAAIIDIGGGDSLLADNLLILGFTNITVLDISANAIKRAKQRLQGKASHIKWIVSDVLDFKPEQKYKVWHDRATFHFLTDSDEQQSYIGLANNSLVANGNLIIGTFAESGPKTCSGLAVKQQSGEGLTGLFNTHFDKPECLTVEHFTPNNELQPFVFCSFKKR